MKNKMKNHFKSNKTNNWYFALVLMILTSLTLPACTASNNSVAPQSETITLRVAVLPILDALPMYVAQQEDLYKAQGIQVELIPVASAIERDQLIASEQIDGAINEALATAYSNRDKIQLQVVRYARAATSEVPLFSILASEKSGITDINGLKGIEIGISEATVIDYLTYRLLQAEGFTADEIQSVAVPKIPDRISLLNSGDLKAAMLPEPASSLAIQQGARLIINDTTHPEYSFSTISFRKTVIDQHPQVIRAFLSAIEEATSRINNEPPKYISLLGEKNIVPPQLIESFLVPTFVTAGVPSQAQWDDMIAWAKEKGLLTVEVSYQDSVTAEYLP